MAEFAGMRIYWVGILLSGLVHAEGPDLASLSAEYVRLRQVRGHFQGGEWNDAVDRWGGQKHQVMGALAQHLGQVGTTTLTLERWMGPPDARDSKRWIYLWRGRHDYLWFEVEAGKVVSSDWWMAGE